MITAQLEALNRKTRILQRLRTGDSSRAIADDERVCRQHVMQLGREAGIRPNGRVKFPTPAERAFIKINAGLDRRSIA